MTIDELKAKVEKHREYLKGNTGKVQMTGEKGPIGITLIDALVEAIEAQQQQIEELQKRFPKP